CASGAGLAARLIGPIDLRLPVQHPDALAAFDDPQWKRADRDGLVELVVLYPSDGAGRRYVTGVRLQRHDQTCNEPEDRRDRGGNHPPTRATSRNPGGSPLATLGAASRPPDRSG